MWALCCMSVLSPSLATPRHRDCPVLQMLLGSLPSLSVCPCPVCQQPQSFSLLCQHLSLGEVTALSLLMDELHAARCQPNQEGLFACSSAEGLELISDVSMPAAWCWGEQQ